MSKRFFSEKEEARLSNDVLKEAEKLLSKWYHNGSLVNTKNIVADNVTINGIPGSLPDIHLLMDTAVNNVFKKFDDDLDAKVSLNRNGDDLYVNCYVVNYNSSEVSLVNLKMDVPTLVLDKNIEKERDKFLKDYSDIEQIKKITLPSDYKYQEPSLVFGKTSKFDFDAEKNKRNIRKIDEHEKEILTWQFKSAIDGIFENLLSGNKKFFSNIFQNINNVSFKSVLEKSLKNLGSELVFCNLKINDTAIKDNELVVTFKYNDIDSLIGDPDVIVGAISVEIPKEIVQFIEDVDSKDISNLSNNMASKYGETFADSTTKFFTSFEEYVIASKIDKIVKQKEEYVEPNTSFKNDFYQDLIKAAEEVSKYSSYEYDETYVSNESLSELGSWNNFSNEENGERDDF